MSYNKRIEWKDHVVERPRTYTETVNGDNSKTFTTVWIGRDKLSVAGTLQLATLPERNARFFLGEFFDPKNPDQEYDFYLSVKNSGLKDKSLFVDRLILAKVADGKKK